MVALYDLDTNGGIVITEIGAGQVGVKPDELMMTPVIIVSIFYQIRK